MNFQLLVDMAKHKSPPVPRGMFKSIEGNTIELANGFKEIGAEFMEVMSRIDDEVKPTKFWVHHKWDFDTWVNDPTKKRTFIYLVNEKGDGLAYELWRYPGANRKPRYQSHPIEEWTHPRHRSVCSYDADMACSTRRDRDNLNPIEYVSMDIAQNYMIDCGWDEEKKYFFRK